MRAQTYRHTSGHYFKDASHRVSGSISFVHYFFHSLLNVCIHTTQQNFVAPRQFHQFFPGSGAFQATRAYRDHMAQNLNSELTQKLLRDGPNGNPRGGLSRTGSF